MRTDGIINIFSDIYKYCADLTILNDYGQYHLNNVYYLTQHLKRLFHYRWTRHPLVQLLCKPSRHLGSFIYFFEFNGIYFVFISSFLNLFGVFWNFWTYSWTYLTFSYFLVFVYNFYFIFSDFSLIFYNFLEFIHSVFTYFLISILRFDLIWFDLIFPDFFWFFLIFLDFLWFLLIFFILFLLYFLGKCRDAVRKTCKQEHTVFRSFPENMKLS